MSKAHRPSAPIANRLLNALPEIELQQLMPLLEKVDLLQGKVLYEMAKPIQQVYFPNGGVISLLASTNDGSTVEAALIGNEGMLGTPLLLYADDLCCTAMVQITGTALMINSANFKKAIQHSTRLNQLLLRYVHTLMAQSLQSTACNRFHNVEARLCRWLLANQDRLGLNTLAYTQDFLANMLGTHRVDVSSAASALQQAGLIKYSRGQITILDRAGLEAASCECYGITKADFDKFLLKENK